MLKMCLSNNCSYPLFSEHVDDYNENSILILQEILECGGNKVNNAASLFISKKLGKVPYGFEYAALEIKSHLERVQFSDIVSAVMIM